MLSRSIKKILISYLIVFIISLNVVSLHVNADASFLRETKKTSETISFESVENTNIIRNNYLSNYFYNLKTNIGYN